MKTVLARARGSMLVRNTGAMLAGHVARSAIQAGYFIIIARLLEPVGYGAFIGTVALVGIVAPFASLGSGNVLIQNVSRDRSLFPKYWANAKAITIISGSVLTFLVLAVAWFVLPRSIPIALVTAVTVSDLIFVRLLDLSGQAYMAFERLGRTARLMVMLNAVRLLAAVGMFIFTRQASPTQWAYLYLMSSIVSSVAGLRLVTREFGTGRRDFGGLVGELREGFYFSISLSSQSVYNDIDKTMLAKLSTLGATGIYGAAYRIIDFSFTPIRSLLFASYARFFQHGTSGIRGSLGLAKRLLPIAVSYGILSGILIYFAAPLVPHVLGLGFSDSVEALRLLAFLPLLKAFHYFAADTLTGAGYQRLRSGIQAVVAVFNVGLNLWLIPLFSWRGAAWSSIVSDGLLASILWLAVVRRGRREQGYSDLSLGRNALNEG